MDAILKRNWRESAKANGPIRTGQYWRKRGGDNAVFAVQQKKGQGFKVLFLHGAGGKKRNHSMGPRIIYEYYDKI